MEYNIKLNKQDVAEIIAKNFNTESKNVSFNDDKIEVDVSYNKDVKSSPKKIGFM